MSKYSNLFEEGPTLGDMFSVKLTRRCFETEASIAQRQRVQHRCLNDVPNCTPAYDVFVTDKDGYLTIKNPAPKYQGNAYLT